MKNGTPKSLIFSSLLFLLFACNMPMTKLETSSPFKASSNSIMPHNPTPGVSIESPTPGVNIGNPTPEDYVGIPTPDSPHFVPIIDNNPSEYTVQVNDSLGVIADRFNISIDSIMTENQIVNSNFLSVGQKIIIPSAIIGDISPNLKLIPDSELVNGPSTIGFDLKKFVEEYDGQLKIYRQEVETMDLSGAEILAFVANNYSINPRLLLAVLEYQSGWLSTNLVNIENLSFPVGLEDAYRSGLYNQLSWAADNLNRGYYLWRSNALSAFHTTDGVLNPAHPEINAGTAAIQYLFAKLYPQNEWRHVISEFGFIQTYQNLFGNPFSWTVDNLIPADLTQPELQLPFENGVTWNFTGGPHGGWGNGSAWAGIDFAPQMEVLGCLPNAAWVVAMVEGLIVYSDNGMVIQDLDGDGKQQTGWAITYMHISSQSRVNVGEYLDAGDRIGHPSCEGGYSTGTHVHLARRYNGEWIPASGLIPFNMDNWIVEGTGIEYEGVFIRGNQIIESCECQDPINSIER